MKIEALNCPNCGASVADNSNHCGHCNSRLKTMSCPGCFGTIFQGNRFCPLCGEKAAAARVSAKKVGDCPRCKKKLQLIQVEDVAFCECAGCDGVWMDAETFETVCANSEKQAVVLAKLDEIAEHRQPPKVQYVPCPECGQFMNRNNFARSSGVIIDSCRQHGLWFDAEELPKIIKFIRQGGLDYARQKERAQLEAERSRLRQERFTHAVDRFKSEKHSGVPGSKRSLAIKEFIDFFLN